MIWHFSNAGFAFETVLTQKEYSKDSDYMIGDCNF